MTKEIRKTLGALFSMGRVDVNAYAMLKLELDILDEKLEEQTEVINAVNALSKFVHKGGK